MKPSIFITGGAGLLGANWANAVRNSYYTTIGLQNRQIVIDDVNSCVINLGSVDCISALLKQINPSVVIHCAAMTNVDACEASPELAHFSNVVIAQNVARACWMHGAKLVHISTDHVFSGSTSMMAEDDPICPMNIYARTKAEAECLVLEACPIAIVARTNFFGWGLPYRKSFSDQIIQSLKDSMMINLFSDAFFTPILMESLIWATHKLIDAGASGIFHITGDERLSKYEFGLRIAHFFGFESDLIRPTLLAHRRDLTYRPLDLSLANTKLRSVVGNCLGNVDRQLQLLLAQKQSNLLIELDG